MMIKSVVKGLPFQQKLGELSQDLAAISSYLSVWPGSHDQYSTSNIDELG
jgi:hypothetical protein